MLDSTGSTFKNSDAIAFYTCKNCKMVIWLAEPQNVDFATQLFKEIVQFGATGKMSTLVCPAMMQLSEPRLQCEVANTCRAIRGGRFATLVPIAVMCSAAVRFVFAVQYGTVLHCNSILYRSGS